MKQNIFCTFLLVMMAVATAFAIDAPQTSKTATLDFPANGTLRLNHSVGEVTIEAWDQPNMQITTITSFKDVDRLRKGGAVNLDRVRVSTERKGDEVIVSTAYPRRAFPPAFLMGGATRFQVAYEIKVPRTARLAIEHENGEVHVVGVTGDMHISARQGLITLRLPEAEKISLDARSKIGEVTSDFNSQAGAPQKIFARVAFGDVLILRMAQPAVEARLAK